MPWPAKPRIRNSAGGEALFTTALRRLMKNKEHKPRFMVSTREELEEKLLEGIEQLDRGEGIRGEKAFAELKARSAKRRPPNNPILSVG